MSSFLALISRFAKPYRLYFIVGPLSKTCEVIFDLLTPLVIAWMIDSGVSKGQNGPCIQGGCLLLGMALLGFLVTLICQKMASLASQGIGTRLRMALVKAADSASYLSLLHIGAGSLVTRSTNDVNQIQVAIAMLIRQVIRWPILALGSIVCALVIDLELGFIVSCSIPVIALIFFLVIRITNPLFLKMQTKLDKLSGFMEETLTGIRPIRAFCRSRFMEIRFKKTNETQAKTAIRASKLNALLSPATFLVMNGAALIVLFMAKPIIAQKGLEVGQVMALLGYMNQLLLAIVYVANLVVIFSKAAVSSKRIIEVLDCKQRRDGEEKVSSFTGPLLSVSHISFAYGKESGNALTDVSFALQKGETLGIIGSTGSGKTTLIECISRLFEPQEGEIVFCGKPLNSYAASELASHISTVPQHAVLFSGTIEENLRWRNPAATHEELASALQLASATFVEDLASPVIEGGKNFSGGQKQRLTIARALVGMCDLLLLDDATSALDFATEAHIQTAIAHLPQKPAVILVSQRVHTIEHCDTICVLDKGRIVGLGNHSELLTNCEVYKEFYESQNKASEASYV